MSEVTESVLLPPEDEAFLSDQRSLEGYRTIEYAGKKWHYRLSGIGMLRAKPLGYEVFSIQQDLARRITEAAMSFARAKAEKDKAATNGKKGDAPDVLSLVRKEGERVAKELSDDMLMERYGVVAWAGICPFYPSWTFERFMGLLDRRSVRDLQAVIAEETIATALGALEQLKATREALGLPGEEEAASSEEDDEKKS